MGAVDGSAEALLRAPADTSGKPLLVIAAGQAERWVIAKYEYVACFITFQDLNGFCILPGLEHVLVLTEGAQEADLNRVHAALAGTQGLKRHFKDSWPDLRRQLKESAIAVGIRTITSPRIGPAPTYRRIPAPSALPVAQNGHAVPDVRARYGRSRTSLAEFVGQHLDPSARVAAHEARRIAALPGASKVSLSQVSWYKATYEAMRRVRAEGPAPQDESDAKPVGFAAREAVDAAWGLQESQAAQIEEVIRRIDALADENARLREENGRLTALVRGIAEIADKFK